MKNAKEIKGFPGYWVTEGGEVWSDDRVDSLGRRVSGRWLKPLIDATGYPRVSLWLMGKKHDRRVHRLVAETYMENPNEYPCVNHIDEDKTNNKIENLEWCTYKHNMHHSYESIYSKERALAVAVACSKDYVAIDPDGFVVKINNLAKFCRENNLNEGGFRRMIRGERRQYKGWTRIDRSA